jgi:hypothetical protein
VSALRRTTISASRAIVAAQQSGGLDQALGKWNSTERFEDELKWDMVR